MHTHGRAGGVALRAFRNAAGSLRGDTSEGSDSWAVSQGYVAVTPVGLRSGEERGWQNDGKGQPSALQACVCT